MKAIKSTDPKKKGRSTFKPSKSVLSSGDASELHDEIEKYMYKNKVDLGYIESLPDSYKYKNDMMMLFKKKTASGDYGKPYKS
jgi:spore maturation protein CgeB